jgi:hypothetical protein
MVDGELVRSDTPLVGRECINTGLGGTSSCGSYREQSDDLARSLNTWMLKTRTLRISDSIKMSEVG